MKIAKKVGIILLISISLLSCVLTSGSILIKEKYINKGFEISFLDWDKEDRCQLFLNNDDTLNISSNCKKGNITLIIMSNDGKEKYIINDMNDDNISIDIDQTGTYFVYMYGDGATGKLNISKE